jgi:hypothetical protein
VKDSKKGDTKVKKPKKAGKATTTKKAKVATEVEAPEIIEVNEQENGGEPEQESEVVETAQEETQVETIMEETTVVVEEIPAAVVELEKFEGTNPAPAQVAKEETIFDKAAVLVVNKKYWGVTKTIRSSSVEVRKVNEEAAGAPAAEPKLLSVQKYILGQNSLWKVWSLDEKMTAALDFFSLPGPLRGLRFIPKGFVVQVNGILAKHKEDRQKLIDDWCASDEYQKGIDKARVELGEHFDINDYPPVEQVRKAFGFSWNWVQMGVANLLQEVSGDMFQAEQSKVADQWADVTDEIQLLLRQNLNDLVGTMIEKLAPAADGKKKQFRADSTKAITEFLDNFKIRNITDDEELQIVVEQVRKLASGIDPELVKTDDGFRGTMQKQFSDVKEVLTEMVVEGPRRRVKF